MGHLFKVKHFHKNKCPPFWPYCIFTIGHIHLKYAGKRIFSQHVSVILSMWVSKKSTGPSLPVCDTQSFNPNTELTSLKKHHQNCCSKAKLTLEVYTAQCEVAVPPVCEEHLKS